jgi:hypothetical protein
VAKRRHRILVWDDVEVRAAPAIVPTKKKSGQLNGFDQVFQHFQVSARRTRAGFPIIHFSDFG